MTRLHWSESQCLLRLFPLVISISFAMDVFVPAIPKMNDYFSSSNSTMQASLYLFMLTVAVGQIAIGPMAERCGRRTTALMSAGLFLLGSLLSACSQTILLLLIGRIIQAFGACGTYLLCFIVIRDNFDTQACGRLFSLLCGVNAVIASSAPIIGGILLDLSQSWRSGFYFLSFLAAGIYFACFKNIPDYQLSTPSYQKTSLMLNAMNILKNRYFKQYILITATALLGLYLFCALSPEILIAKLHLSGTQYGLWFGFNAFTVFLANMLAARLTHFLKLEKIVILGLSIMMIASLLMICLNLYATTVLTFMLPMLTLTIGIGLAMGCATALCLKDFVHQAGLATAMVGACQFGLAGIVGAVIAQFILSPLSLAVSVLILCLVGLLRLWQFKAPELLSRGVSS